MFTKFPFCTDYSQFVYKVHLFCLALSKTGSSLSPETSRKIIKSGVKAWISLELANSLFELWTQSLNFKMADKRYRNLSKNLTVRSGCDKSMKLGLKLN